MTSDKKDEFIESIYNLIAELEYVQEKLEDDEPDVAYEELGNQAGTIQTMLNEMRKLL